MGGKGKGKGVMMWVPVSQVNKVKQASGGKGGGSNRPHYGRQKTLGQRAAPEKKIWLDGLPTIEDHEKRREASKKLHEQFKKTTDCKFVEIRKNGQGTAVFGSEEDAQAALEALAGTKFRGKVIEVDVWEKMSK